MDKILIILDGAAGLGINIFGGKTAIEKAKTPNLDYLTKNGKLGYMYPINEKTIPGSDNAIISILGNDFKLSKRGVFEAVGLGMKFRKGDLALRCNLGTIESFKTKKVIDRRAGRTLSTQEMKILAYSINKDVKLKCKFEFKAAVQHRAVLVLKGDFSDKISSVDPEWGRVSDKEKFSLSKPLNSSLKAKKTAEIINDFLIQANKILKSHPVNILRKKKGLLPANMVFLRGAGIEVPKLRQYRKWMSINSMPLEIGISKISGMKIYSFKYPELKGIDVYSNLYDGLNKSIKFSKKIIKKFHKDFSGCYIQFKETDLPGHDNKPLEKKKMIELLDKKFFGFLRKFLEKNPAKLVVSCDHSTPCNLKRHSSNPVPLLFYGDGADNTDEFSETQAKKGELGKIYGKNLMEKLRFF